MKREKVVIYFMVAAMLFSSVAIGLIYAIQSSNRNEPTETVNDSNNKEQNDEQTSLACETSMSSPSNSGTPSGDWPFVTEKVDALQVIDVRPGSGAEAVLGDCITVHYRLALSDGTEVAGNNTFGGEPISFELIEGGLIAGWVQGVPGLKEGGLRRLIVPSSLGYGDQSTASIPAGSTLVFDIELVKVEK